MGISEGQERKRNVWGKEELGWARLVLTHTPEPCLEDSQGHLPALTLEVPLPPPPTPPTRPADDVQLGGLGMGVSHLSYTDQRKPQLNGPRSFPLQPTQPGACPLGVGGPRSLLEHVWDLLCLEGQGIQFLLVSWTFLCFQRIRWDPCNFSGTLLNLRVSP